MLLGWVQQTYFNVTVGESLERSSAAMKAANNTLEETTALTIAANNVIQDPKTVGNALKTVSMDKLVA